MFEKSKCYILKITVNIYLFTFSVCCFLWKKQKEWFFIFSYLWTPFQFRNMKYPDRLHCRFISMRIFDLRKFFIKKWIKTQKKFFFSLNWKGKMWLPKPIKLDFVLGKKHFKNKKKEKPQNLPNKINKGV